MLISININTEEAKANELRETRRLKPLRKRGNSLQLSSLDFVLVGKEDNGKGGVAIIL